MPKAVEQIYQKKTQQEHILLRPDSYIGSTEHIEEYQWILHPSKKKIINKKIRYVPGLYKVFDEILVNACDNYQRDRRMTEIKVNIDRSIGKISVYNNGHGIPVKIHGEHGIYVPELIFGHLLTSSNYNDSEKKVTGGRNGFGAKLANIFAKKFRVETVDGRTKKKFEMCWSSSMREKSEAKISAYEGGTLGDYTQVEFEPDLKLFSMKKLDDDIVNLFEKRVYDLAGILPKSVKIYLHGRLVKIDNFEEYTSYYPTEIDSDNITNNDLEEDKTDLNQKRFFERINNRWEIVFGLSEGKFRQVSFVNGICTSQGGTHVNVISDQICEYLLKAARKKAPKDTKIENHVIKNNIWIFINTLLDNPTFSSQTKETLTSKPNNFGTEYTIPERFLKQILKSGIMEHILAQAKAKANVQVQKALSSRKTAKVTGVEKLEDSNWAGTTKSPECCLILTEGDSAKCLAMAGLDIVGRDQYGVFPLKGKQLNVREASSKILKDNEEIQNIVKILGLSFAKEYSEENRIKDLRYGKVMIMADQDHDGSHIKGLIINMFHYFWPSLLTGNKFLKEFVTPIIKATKKNNPKDSETFFTVKDYENWLNDLEPNLKNTYKIKYYKGLGTSTDKEAKEYFQNLKKHEIVFKYENTQDDESIDLVFNKDRADDRKKWINGFDPNLYVDHKIKTLSYQNFINKELIQFSIANNKRAIPSVVDGLKPGQRKILYACFKRGLKSEIKVAQLAGYVAEHSAYHHGEASLTATIVNMAQDFMGTNNQNLLMPIGQFGSRHGGSKEAASARYIYTNLSPLTRYLFCEADNNLLEYLEDDGQLVEPNYYVPIIPMVLVNGTEGIGMGWSTNVPSFDPLVLIDEIFKLLSNDVKPKDLDTANDEKIVNELEDKKEQIPWYKYFKGEISRTSGGVKSFTVKGAYEIYKTNFVRITEQPVATNTNYYKKFLLGLMESKSGTTKAKDSDIKNIKEYHTRNTIHFDIEFNESCFESYQNDLEKKLKLSTPKSDNNMVLYNSEGVQCKYDSAKEILLEFYKVRLSFYKKRRTYLLMLLRKETDLLESKARFVGMIVNDELEVKKVKKEEIIKKLKDLGFKTRNEIFSSNKFSENLLAEEKEQTPNNENEREGDELGRGDSGWNYLLGMNLWQFTEEKVEELMKDVQKKNGELEKLMKKTAKDLWTEDLKQFKQKYQEELHKQEDEINRELEIHPKKNSIKKSSKARSAPKQAKESKDVIKNSTYNKNSSKEYPTKKKKKESTCSESEEYSEAVDSIDEDNTDEEFDMDSDDEYNEDEILGKRKKEVAQKQKPKMKPATTNKKDKGQVKNQNNDVIKKKAASKKKKKEVKLDDSDLELLNRNMKDHSSDSEDEDQNDEDTERSPKKEQKKNRTKYKLEKAKEGMVNSDKQSNFDQDLDDEKGVIERIEKDDAEQKSNTSDLKAQTEQKSNSESDENYF